MKLIRLYFGLAVLFGAIVVAGFVGVLLTIGNEAFPYRMLFQSVCAVVIGGILAVIFMVLYVTQVERHRRQREKERRHYAKRYPRAAVVAVRKRYNVAVLEEVVACRDSTEDLEEDLQTHFRRPPRLRPVYTTRRGDPHH
ncbi:MAG TPA: hypothetical protein VMR75_00250 [Candidatus Saccharimonadales bacterium]|nr:hypothetical protein [Candidatus Saccharimonadales bacterium]